MNLTNMKFEIVKSLSDVQEVVPPIKNNYDIVVGQHEPITELFLS